MLVPYRATFLAALTGSTLAGCFEPSVGDGTETDGSGDESGANDGGSRTAGTPGDDGDDVDDGAATAGSEGDGTWPGSSTGNGETAGQTEGSTGSLVIECGDGRPVPGEVCFGPVLTVEGGAAAYNLALAPLDGDDRPDILIGERNRATVFIGDGAGGFAARETFNSIEFSNGSGQMVLAPVDDDVLLDLLATGGGGVIASSRGLGDGTFAGPVESDYPGVNADGLLTGDFTGDGIVDALVARSSGFDVYLATGVGDGTFTFSEALPVEEFGAMAAGDFDGDERLDAVIMQRNAEQVVLLRNADGTGLLPEPGVEIDVGADLGYSNQAAAGDLDGDSIDDVVFVLPDESEVLVSFGAQGKGPQSPILIPAGTRPRDVSVMDMDGDGFLDLVTCGAGVFAGVHVMLGDGAGGFAEPIDFPGSACTLLAVGDIDGNGVPDVIYHEGGSNGLRVLVANP